MRGGKGRERESDIRIKLIKSKGKGSGETFVMKYEDCGERGREGHGK